MRDLLKTREMDRRDSCRRPHLVGQKALMLKMLNALYKAFNALLLTSTRPKELKVLRWHLAALLFLVSLRNLTTAH